MGQSHTFFLLLSFIFPLLYKASIFFSSFYSACPPIPVIGYQAYYIEEEDKRIPSSSNQELEKLDCRKVIDWIRDLSKISPLPSLSGRWSGSCKDEYPPKFHVMLKNFVNCLGKLSSSHNYIPSKDQMNLT